MQICGIKINSYEIIPVKGKNVLFINAEIEESDEVIACPACGSVSFYKKGCYERKVKHTSILNMPTIIKFKQRRFECRDCKKTFNAQTNFVQKNCRISNDIKTTIINECRRVQKFEDIGDRLNISASSVEREFDKNVYIDRLEMTRVIAIDEFKANTEYGKFALAIGDPVSGEIIDILPKKTQEYIQFHLNKLKQDELNTVEYYITDLCESYRTIHRIYFPNATHIADRFHWIKLATKAFNDTRISEMKAILLKAKHAMNIEEKNSLLKMYKIIKSNYKLFIANRYKKEPAYFDTELSVSLSGKEIVTIQDVLEFVLNSNETIKQAYDLLQSLYKIAALSTYENYNSDIEEWYKDVRTVNNARFKSVMNTYKSWKAEIRNSFIINPITLSRLTNGFMEGKNNYFKVIKRVAFGYKKFDVLRNRIMYETNKNITIKNK